MKKIILLLLVILATPAFAQKATLRMYLKGMVPEQNGKVVFEKDYQIEGAKKGVIYEKLHTYAQNVITESAHEEISKFTLQQPAEGYLVANIQETLYFKKKAWSSDFTEMAYRILFTIEDGKFNMKVQDIRYQYEGENLTAEKWITDKYALKRDGKELSKDSGKCRRFTIDRIQALMDGAYEAAKQ